ncbi:OmpA/MotB domain protein [Emticicia oligotrophica DSM 17448]|uniref:OmpA/MotB domain protein n=1 Tax=Emticicia oligotrophica (strain DSM 17448 / CIP 109782 / MTCC 6937 / GPTSA100-15) TaxID=929562 RepID=A0ABM5N028_EMTOG|nr:MULTISPECIES: OmpA family protein [Emticicia]AFK02802.1 OmpA/MotB domain protein [Emticicia oligotrophica DSM 17448]
MRKTVFFLLTASLYFSTEQLFAQNAEHLGSAVNTEFNELNPVIAPDGKTLYFVRVSHPSNNYGAKGSQDVWYSESRDGSWTIARRMPNSINKDQYNDLYSITPDGNTILISGVYNGGRRENEVGLSTCKRTKTGWSEPQRLIIPKFDDLCKGQFLTACLSNDGKTLILAFSEKRNSKEDDLYVSFLGRDGKWTKPESLGDNINTGDTETTPFLASDNYTLYFASDRKGGLGGTDIWVSKRLDRSWRRWSKPINMGDKVNTDANELSYTISASGEYAYMSSKKNSVGKGDIVRFKLRDDKKQEPVIAGGVQTSNNRLEEQKSLSQGKSPVNTGTTTPTPVVMISGRVVDQKTGRPIEAKIVYQTLPDGEEVGEAYTNPNTGEYKIVLPYGAKYSYRAEAKDFIAIGKNIDLTEIKEFKEIDGDDLKLVPIKEGEKVPLNNIFFEYAKATLRSESFPELDRIAETLKENGNLTIEIQGHTDNVGSNESNLKLSQDRAEAVRSYLLSKKLPANRVTSVGFGETRPVASNDTEEGRAQNRRVEFTIVKK